MLELILVIIGLIAISFLCSILEAVILSVTQPYIEVLAEKNSSSGSLLKKLKANIDEPISAILTLNTISHTAGAAVSGALALRIFGSEWMALFSAVLTLLILIFSEIIPKTIGANYWKRLGPFTAFSLRIMVLVLKPLIVPVNLLSRLISRGSASSEITRAEIKNFIRLGYFQGIIESDEFQIVDNVLKLKSVLVRDVMTPRSVVFTLSHKETVGELQKKNIIMQFSRIPLRDEDGESVTGIVLRRDIMSRIFSGELDGRLSGFAMVPSFVRESVPVYDILDHMVARRIHMYIVTDDNGNYTGIITLEDAIETLLGKEIVDEFDPAVDMRSLAE